MSDDAKANLLEILSVCRNAEGWVVRSFERSPKPPFEHATAEEWDHLEALAGRYARLTDLIIHKLFRAIDRLEFESTGSLLDSANRAVKRGLAQTTDELRELKDIRNEVVHEYAIDDLAGLYEDIHGATPRVLALMDAVESYLRRVHGINR